MDWILIATVVGVIIPLVSGIGAILLKAFVNPVKTEVEGFATLVKDHEDRIRRLETQGSEHGIHLENLLKAVDRLVYKIDELVTYEKAERLRSEKNRSHYE